MACHLISLQQFTVHESFLHEICWDSFVLVLMAD